MAQPDISQILAALANTQPTGTPQASTPQHVAPPNQPPLGYPPGMAPGQYPNAPPPQAAYLPQPSNTGNIDLSGIKPVNSGSVSIADAIAKARNIAENRGLASYDSRQAPAPRDDPRLAGRGNQRSRSRSPPRRDAYSANPYRDERREDPRRGNYRRSPSPDRNFRGARDPPAGHRGNDGETETIRVKSALVGLIIGRNGENLRKVETETGARVQFIQANDKHIPERQCTISGPLRARESAKAAIFAIIEENGGTPAQPEKGAYTAGMPGRAKVNLPALRDGEASTQIMVPDKTVGLIIGRGGETIKDLQERSGCHVNIVGENKSVSGLRPVNLIGSERATAVAKEMILEIVESDNRDGNQRGAPGGGSMPPAGRDQGYQNNGRGGGGGGGGGRDHVEKTISVPSEAVGMIIGKGGETIKDMQRSTGCKINVNQPKPPDVNRDIDLAGTASAMEEAERVIWEKVETVRERDAASGRGNQGGGGGGGGYGGGGGRDQGSASYGAYSQPQQQAPAYGQQYGAQQPQMPVWGQPQQSSATPTQQPGAQSEADVYAAQQWYAQWVAMAQQQAQQQQQGQQPPGGGQ